MGAYSTKQLQLFEEIETQCKTGDAPSHIVSETEDYEHDTRICFTSVVFLPENLKEIIINKVTDQLKEIDTTQYFFPANALHLTIQNIRTISDPPLFTEKDITIADKIFQTVISRNNSFSIDLHRLFELPTSLAICGFSNETLIDLVLDLRQEMNIAGIPDNKKYASDSVFIGNTTVCRYTHKPNEDFFQKVAELKNVEIGSFTVKDVSLITSNAVCSKNTLKIINTYQLQD